MSRFQQQTPDAGAATTEFNRGVAYVRPGDRLPPGYYRRLINGEVRNGIPETRRGSRKITWMMNNGAALGDVWQCVQEFRPSRNDFSRPPRVVLAIIDKDLWVCAPGNQPKKIHADVTTFTHKCQIIPAFNVALILRNLSQVPILYDPYNAQPSGAFLGTSGMLRGLPAATVGKVLPAAATGCYHAGRIWLKSGYDEIIASDIFEFRYTSSNVFRVESGGNGEIVRLWPYGESSVAVFKTDGVHRLRYATGDLSEMVIENVYGSHGCVAPDTVRQEGDSIFYLTSAGVEVLNVTGDSLVLNPAEAFSRNAHPFFRGITWPAATASRGLIVDNYYALSVPSRATWRAIDPLAERWGGVPPIISGFELGEPEAGGSWEYLSEDFVVSGSEAYSSSGWESFDETP